MLPPTGKELSTGVANQFDTLVCLLFLWTLGGKGTGGYSSVSHAAESISPSGVGGVSVSYRLARGCLKPGVVTAYQARFSAGIKWCNPIESNRLRLIYTCCATGDGFWSEQPVLSSINGNNYYSQWKLLLTGTRTDQNLVLFAKEPSNLLGYQCLRHTTCSQVRDVAGTQSSITAGWNRDSLYCMFRARLKLMATGAQQDTYGSALGSFIPMLVEARCWWYPSLLMDNHRLSSDFTVD